MTIRAVLLGFIGACCICGFTYFNDRVMHQTFFIGHYLPIGVYGSLLLFVMLLNPLLARYAAPLALKGKEIVVVLALMLAACCVPGPGLMRTFTGTQILPHHYNKTDLGWKTQQVIEMVPPQMLVDVTEENQSDVLGGFIKGLEKKDDADHIGLLDIPWYAWGRTLACWLPMILALFMAMLGLSIVVHRQWSSHEQLPYPIATFAHSLLPGEGSAWGGLFRSRLFWIGTLVVLAIHLNNFACVTYPDKLIPIKTTFDFMPLRELFPTFFGGFTHVLLLRPQIFFIAIAIAYFLAADVSLSLALGPFLYCAMLGVFGTYGVSLIGGGYLQPKPLTFLFFGAFFGTFLALLHMGRHYYSLVFRRAVFLPAAQQPEQASLWGARVFLIGFALFVVMLIGLGVEWQIALLYAGLMVMIFLVQSRILAETGAFFMRAYWWPCVALAGFFGIKALDPQTVLILMLVTVVFALDPREALMPFMVNSLKLLDLRKVPVGRTSGLCALVVVVGLVVAIPVTLYFQYDRGMDKTDTRGIVGAPRVAFQETVRVKQRLEAQDSLEATKEIHGWGRFANLQPNVPCAIGFGAGLGLVLLFTFCRLRFARWPLHPVMFLLWHNYPGGVMAVSFLIGWLIKVAVTKYGGAGGYQKLKPLMFGLIAGEILGATVPMIIGGFKFFLTGEPPTTFNIMPG